MAAGLHVCLEENIRVRHTHTRPHLEEALTPHTFIASPIRGEGREEGSDTERERQKERRGRDVFHKCSSIKSTDPNGIQ